LVRADEWAVELGIGPSPLADLCGSMIGQTFWTETDKETPA
jgi:hypothetical protein